MATTIRSIGIVPSCYASAHGPNAAMSRTNTLDHEHHSDVAVATCRQTVDALLAPHHRLAADGYDSTRSHLSPDGGGLTRADHLEAQNALNA